MATSSALKPGFCLIFLPYGRIKLSNIGIKCFADKGTGRDGSVAVREGPILAMTFMQYASQSSVERINCNVIQIINQGIQKLMGMLKSCFPSISVVLPRYTVVISDCWSD